MSMIETAAAPIYFDEAQWVDNLKQGDEAAWEVLMARCAVGLRQAIIQMLRKRGLPLDLLDDVEGETWRTVVRRIGSFDWQGDDKLKHWLHKIAFHHVQSFQRVDRHYLPSMEDIEARNLENDFALDLFLFANGLIEISAEEEVLLLERLADLDSALQALSGRDREIFLATLFDNVGREDLARRYGLEEDTVSQIVWRAKGKLRGQLKSRHAAQEASQYER